VDAAFEAGGGLAYQGPWYEAFAVARQGFGGHDGTVAEIGMDVIARPSDRLTLTAGPFLLFGSDDYAATYFSTDTGFEAEGGLLSSGVEVGAEYRLSDAWGVEADVRFERLRGDAGDSPVSAEDDQVSAGLAVTRRFTFAF
jgi:outer membrane scaffolding protein for murein synthesis (MipA/OmpV family)